MEENRHKYRIGVVGYSNPDKFDQDAGEEVTRTILEKIFNNFNDLSDVELVSGLTDIGIPGIAYRVADEYGVYTVGYACEKAEENDIYPVDESHIVGDDWGDESDYFLGRLTHLIRIGGGKQAHEETEKFKEMKGEKRVYETDIV